MWNIEINLTVVEVIFLLKKVRDFLQKMWSRYLRCQPLYAVNGGKIDGNDDNTN